MPAIPKIPETLEEYQIIIKYLQSKTIPNDIQQDPTKKSNFIRHCKKFEVDENNFLYVKPIMKDGITLEKRCVIPKYDEEIRALILEHFHDQANHREYHKTFFAISEKHIGITQEEVRTYVNQCNTCIITTSIKKKTDMKNVISTAPCQHIQIDLIDFQDFAKVNNDFAWLLTCICVFSKFLIAVSMKNKEASTVATHLIKDVFKVFGPPMIIQSDNGKEFVARIITEICEALNITIRHGRPRHPQSQGQIERLNQTVGHGFTKLLWNQSNQLQRKDWINVIDMFVMSYNSTVHKAHGCTPHEAIFGWKMHCVYDTPDFSRTIATSETSTSKTITATSKITVFETTTSETITDKAAMEQCISHMLKIHQSINASLEKYREKLGCNNVHRKKMANNTIKTGTEVAIALDHNMNQQTHKRKLQPTFSERGVFKSLKSNNHTAIVEVNGKDVQIPVKRSYFHQDVAT
ncbi:13058_t:CDS:2 [Acaulospora morrowiae]|uniref:13058_t:CDS:1 n=1 Tax=Acaulospora morrowiae TaxID=94023 RepID=A0A9N9CHE7_9GLOM|nr:13058_t:CDS:2 [Acaulospora morrowiae]